MRRILNECVQFTAERTVIISVDETSHGGVLFSELDLQSDVQNVKKNGAKTVPCRVPVFEIRVPDRVFSSSLTYCVLSDRIVHDPKRQI